MHMSSLSEWRHGGFTFNHYVDADLSEYDLFTISSEASVDELEELGARDLLLFFGRYRCIAKMQLD